MTIYDRPDEKVVAESAHAGEVLDFPDILRGWGIAFDQTGGLPPVEWVNGLARRADRAIRYFMQRGLPEWSATEDYPQGAYVQYAGTSYLSKRANTNKAPNANVNDWGRWSITRDEFDAGTTGRLLNVQTFTASGTYTKTPGTKNIRIRAVAGGGGGGGVSAPSASQVVVGGGGSAGAYAECFIAVPAAATTSVTIGAGGPGGTPGSNGASGGSTSFGALLVLNGGPGGSLGTPAVPPVMTTSAGATTTGTLPQGTVFSIAGTSGPPGIGVSLTSVNGGGGGSNPFATGQSRSIGTGATGQGQGAGGSGASAGGSGAAASGGNGALGFMVIEEYA